MNRKLKRREITIIFVLTAVLLGLIYYQFIYKAVKQAETDYDTTELDTEILTEQTKMANKLQMEAEIEANKGNETGVIATYDSIKGELNALNDILADAETFNLSFDQPTATDDAVRRVVAVSFTAADYNTAKTILTNLRDCSYRCLIGDVSMTTTTLSGSSSTSQDLSSSAVAVDLTVTFYETLYDSDTTEGLVIEESSSSDSSGLLNDLASDKERAESTGEDTTE